MSSWCFACRFFQAFCRIFNKVPYDLIKNWMSKNLQGNQIQYQGVPRRRGTKTALGACGRRKFWIERAKQLIVQLQAFYSKIKSAEKSFQIHTMYRKQPKVNKAQTLFGSKLASFTTESKLQTRHAENTLCIFWSVRCLSCYDGSFVQVESMTTPQSVWNYG